MKCIPPVSLPDPRYVPFRQWTRQEIRSYAPSDCKTYRVHHWRFLAEGWPANRDDVLVWAWRFVGHELRRAIRGDEKVKRYWLDRIEDAVLDDFMRRFGALAATVNRDRPYPALCQRIRHCIWDAQHDHRVANRRFLPYVDWHLRMATAPPRPEREIMFRDDWKRFAGRLEAMFLSPRLARDRGRVYAAFRGEDVALPGYFLVRARSFVLRAVAQLRADAPAWVSQEDSRTALDALRPDEEFGIYDR